MWILVGLAPRLGLFEYRFATALGTMAGCAIVAALAAKMARRLAATDSERQAHQLWLRRDLPELAQALRERDRTRLMLERTNHDLDEFAYAASHDLRAPLRGIANLAQWVEEDLGESVASSTRHQLNLLRGRVHRMETLIDDILAYSRAGRSSQPPCLVVVAELVAEIIQRLSPPPRARFVTAPDLPELMTDRGQLQLVFFNLLSNTLKHARRDDLQVEIKASPPSITTASGGCSRRWRRAIRSRAPAWACAR
jgi:light-regulated signal transduction histidine kinase (bacteriophytochrome)